MTLDELKIGESATVTYVGGSGSLRQHFLDMGLIPGSVVTLEKFAPMGDPMELRIHGYEIIHLFHLFNTIFIQDSVKVVNIMIKRLKILYQKEHRLPLR